MRSISVVILLAAGALPVVAQEAVAPPEPKVVSSDTCLYGIPANANQVAAAKSVTIVKCKLTAPLIPDESVNRALSHNSATNAATKELPPHQILATTASGSNVTIYVEDND